MALKLRLGLRDLFIYNVYLFISIHIYASRTVSVVDWQVVRNAGRDLDTVLSTNLPLLNTFVEAWRREFATASEEQCGELLVSTGENKEYMLDMCIQRAAVCLDNAEAQHIGCCCSTIPLGGTFGITGEGETGTNSSRRLAAEAEPVDICAEARALRWTKASESLI